MGSLSKIFTATDAIKHEHFTILVESIDPIGGETFVVIEAIEGEYKTREEFMDAREYIIQGREKGYTRTEHQVMLYSSITIMLPGTRQLADTLNEFLAASEEG